MAVDVKEDGHTWGRLESKQQWIKEGNAANDWPSQGLFVILKMPPVPVAGALALLEEQFETDAGIVLFNLRGPKRFRRRRWRVLTDSLSQNARDTMRVTGEFTTTFSAIRTFIRRIRDGAQYTGLG